ncbi:MAG TPA: TonB-dependent receptor plug domain-containing protein [Solimonas sp.]|nr:TonB-dependent receptor plug domain-containing protein [Solimonas sp.]
MRRTQSRKWAFVPAIPIALCPLLACPVIAMAQETAPQEAETPASTFPDDAALEELLASPETPETTPPAEAAAAPKANAAAAAQPEPDAPLDLIPLPEQAAALPPAAPAKKAPRSTIEEIVVTARRTAESQQDVPIAISAMSSDDLRREQINSPQDLQGRVPSLLVGSGSQMRNTETPTIRGQGAQFGASPGVVIYLGEVPLPSDPVANYQGGAGKFFDLSNVQVLKGSQGTLFGRNTTGGALLLEPQKPQEELSGSLRAGAMSLSGEGGLTGHSYEAVLNTPIIGETLLARIGGQVYQRDGFTRDVVTGKDYDSKDYWTARLGLLWHPSERIENYLMGYVSDSHDNGTAIVIERVNREGLNRAIPGAIGLGVLSTLLPGLDLAQTANLGCLALNAFGPSTNCGQDIVDEQAARGVRRVQLSGDPNDILKTGAVVDKFSFELTDELTLVNIASYSTLEHSYRWDLDGSRAQFNEFINPDDMLQADVQTTTEELQLQGTAFDDKLQYAVGGFYESTDAKGRIVAKSLLFVDVDQQYELEKTSFAPFAQGTYDLGGIFDSLSGLSLTVGARRTTDKTAVSASIQQLALGLVPLVDKDFQSEIENSEWTWTAGLDYKIGEQLVYGKVSRGYKTGGIAPIAVNPDHYTYEPEYVINYELGQKADFEIGGMPVRLNSAIYYTDYTGLQKAGIDAYVDPSNPSPVPQLGQAIFNVGSAWVAGFEMDLTVQPSPGLTLLATYGYTEAEYEEFSFGYNGATPQLDCSGQEVARGGTVELSCIPFQDIPKQQFSLSGRYLLPLDPAVGDVEASMTYAHTSRKYSGQSSPPEAEPGAYLPAVGLLNGSLSWSRVFGSSFSAQLFGTNLTNELYRISNSNQWNLTYFQSSIYSEPRIIGMNLSYEW